MYIKFKQHFLITIICKAYLYLTQLMNYTIFYFVVSWENTIYICVIHKASEINGQKKINISFVNNEYNKIKIFDQLLKNGMKCITIFLPALIEIFINRRLYNLYNSEHLLK